MYSIDKLWKRGVSYCLWLWGNHQKAHKKRNNQAIGFGMLLWVEVIECYFYSILFSLSYICNSFQILKNMYNFKITKAKLNQRMLGRYRLLCSGKAQWNSSAIENTALVFPQIQDLPMPKRAGSTQIRLHLIDSTSFAYRSCVSQQHGSPWTWCLPGVPILRFSKQGITDSQLWPHVRHSDGALKIYACRAPYETNENYDSCFNILKNSQVFLSYA